MQIERKRITTVLKGGAASAALLLIMLWAAGILRTRQDGGKLPHESGQPLPTTGTIMTVAYTPVPELVALSGTVHSEQQINLSARLPAYVESIHVNAGDRVPEGQLLIALDQRELREEQTAAQAALQQAETAFERSERLLETNATTPQAHENAQSNFLAARAQAERIAVMLSYTRLQAPIDGIVTDRFVEAGDLASMGQPLVSIFDPARLRIEVPVPASLVQLFTVGTDFDVNLDQDPHRYQATVTEIVSAFDPITRTRRVKLRLEDAGGGVLPGMYGQVIVPVGTSATILLPANAITNIGQLESVMIVHNDRLHRRLVRTGPPHNNKISIISGLQPGDQIWIPADLTTATEGASSDV